MTATQSTICTYGLGHTPGEAVCTASLTDHLSHPPRHFDSFTELMNHLQSPATARDIIVLAPADSDELAALLPHKRLQDRRLVLVLPDAEEATLSMAHLLGPRYLCFADDVGTDLAAVLNKMAKKGQLQSEGAH